MDNNDSLKVSASAVVDFNGKSMEITYHQLIQYGLIQDIEFNAPSGFNKNQIIELKKIIYKKARKSAKQVGWPEGELIERVDEDATPWD